MIKFYNTKMMHVGSAIPGKGTYAYDKMGIEELKPDFPEKPDDGLISAITENVITYFESDHPVETEEPDAEKQIIHNHDYTLQVDPAEEALVRESKEMLDAKIRANVVQSFEEPDDSDDPSTDQNV